MNSRRRYNPSSCTSCHSGNASCTSTPRTNACSPCNRGPRCTYPPTRSDSSGRNHSRARCNTAYNSSQRPRGRWDRSTGRSRKHRHQDNHRSKGRNSHYNHHHHTLCQSNQGCTGDRSQKGSSPSSPQKSDTSHHYCSRSGRRSRIGKIRRCRRDSQSNRCRSSPRYLVGSHQHRTTSTMGQHRDHSPRAPAVLVARRRAGGDCQKVRVAEPQATIHLSYPGFSTERYLKIVTRRGRVVR